MVLVGVVVAGALGAVSRFVVDGLVRDRTHHPFPFWTLTVNVTGAFALGVLAGYFIQHVDAPESFRAVAGVGFIGAYTTFSTWMFETFDLARRGHWRHAAFNVLGSLAAGMATVAVGLWVGGLL